MGSMLNPRSMDRTGVFPYSDAMIFTAKAIEDRKAKVAHAWDDLLKTGECVLVYAGDPMTKPGGLDQTYDYLPHPSYFWLTGYRLPAGVAAYSKDLGWTFFVRPQSQAELVWEGAAEFEEHGTHVSEFDNFIHKHSFKKIFSLGQAPKTGVHKGGTEQELFELKRRMDRVRRAKDNEEIALVRKVAGIAHRGYAKMRSIIRPGMTERELQVEYEAEIFRAGAHGVPYGTLVGSGKNASVLHAVPSARVFKNGDWVLVDGGAETYDYCVDITRMFSVGGAFSTQQQHIYDTVKKAQAEGIAHARIGVEWSSVHEVTARVIAHGLKDSGLVRGSVEDMISTGAISVFYPHGVGHLVGLRVRDTGQEENTHPKKYCGVFLRVDFPLEENFMITVEPGCYFVEPLLRDPQVRKKYGDLINWQEAEKWLDVGGVRIEDDVVITKSTPDVLTAMVEK